MNTAEVYGKVTASLISRMEAGVVPWAKAWHTPISIHGHSYRGINALVLGLSDYASPVWLTYHHAKKLGGNVRKGEKGAAVLLWRQGRTRDLAPSPDCETRRGMYCTTFTVFNFEQCEGLELPAKFASAPSAADPAAAADAIAAEYLARGPRRTDGGSSAYYSPSEDRVNLPARSAFTSAGGYYSTLFHELTHSTGHASRLSREGITDPIKFASHNYTCEELVAEIGAAFLCARAGLDTERTIENSAAYLKGWLGKLNHDRKFLVTAASAAQKAVDLIAGAPSVSDESEAA
jgi:antirestriction protein ArdC